MHVSRGYSLPPGLRAVVCEDEGFIANHHTRVLQKLGVASISLVQSFESLVVVTAIERPDLIISEVYLSDDSDGIEDLAAISKSAPVCIVIVSSSPEEDLPQIAAQAGAVAALPKPVSCADLEAAIAGAFQRYRAKVPWAAMCPEEAAR